MFSFFSKGVHEFLKVEIREMWMGKSAASKRTPPRTWRRTSALPLCSGSRDPLLQLGKVRFVVRSATADDVVRFGAVVHVGDLDPRTGDAGSLFIGEEVVLQTCDQGRRAFPHVAPAAVQRVAFHHGNDLVVGLIAVDHAQAADRNGPQDYVAVREALL